MTEHIRSEIKPIDIEALFREKNPKLARLLPGFIYRYINRIMHISEINEIILTYGHQEGIDFANSTVQYFNVSQKVYGLENVPREGRFIFAANHPLGGFDSLLLMHNVYNQIGELRFLVNDVLMKIYPLKSIFVPINKHGGHNREIAEIIHREYSSDVQILIFPSGFASRKVKGKVTDLDWKKHFIQKAIEYQRDVIPVHISGRNSNFFYNLANLRSFLRIKWNLEMFFLSDETFRHKNQEFTLTFGKPISYKRFDKTKTQKQWADEVKRILYSLPGQRNK
ncbi:1-acyl-sn-glycerol-3-phosphate acyltransferase [Gaoshiqia sp. Z1-71]|uniref:1-acyl-sn-glycerol-3-phosphate acyltransferase n=1 Tax=Gaoshiqia hydrogeniformans TaxID=3290090 RepID=UPI003BF8C70A